VELAKHHLILS